MNTCEHCNRPLWDDQTESPSLLTHCFSPGDANCEVYCLWTEERLEGTALRSQLTAALAKVVELEQELADVRALDASGDDDWGMFARPPGHGVGCKHSGRLFTGSDHAAARRAAVEYLKKEGKDE